MLSRCTCTTCVFVSALTYQLAWQAFNRERDLAMEQIAHSVVRHGVRPGSWATNPPSAPTSANDLGGFISQIWSPTGEILYSSVEGTGPPWQQAGFHEVVWSGESWHVYTLVDQDHSPCRPGIFQKSWRLWPER
jgi:two-component system, OmpR family, sensor kinase